MLAHTGHRQHNKVFDIPYHAHKIEGTVARIESMARNDISPGRYGRMPALCRRRPYICRGIDSSGIHGTWRCIGDRNHGYIRIGLYRV